MSGHSHWATIKHKKGKADAARGKAFSRVSKQIIQAARRGGKDPEQNLELKYAIEEAKAINMPKETIQRAILRGVGELEGQKVEAVRYEGYGPGGAALIIEAVTDNRNRTTPHVRRLLDQYGGQLGATGCVSWTFETKGLILVPQTAGSEEKLLELAIEAGAEDFQAAGDMYEIKCNPRDLARVRDALTAAGVPVESAQITQVPKTYVTLDGENARKMLKLMEELEADDDITSVHSNFDLAPELAEQLSSQQ